MNKYNFQQSGTIPSSPFKGGEQIHQYQSTYGIGTSQFDQNINPDIFNYNNKYTAEQQIEHIRANNQSFLDLAGAFTVNLASDILINIAKTGVTAADYSLGYIPPISEYIIKPVDGGLTAMQDYIHENVGKVYKSKEYDEAGIVGKLFTGAGFAGDVENGLGFILGNIATGAILGKLGLGAATVGSKYLKDLIDPKKASKIAGLIDDGISTVLSAGNESVIEGQETYKHIKESLTNERVDSLLRGEAPKHSNEDIENIANRAKTETAAFNMALLTFSNFLDFRAIRGSFTDDVQRIAYSNLVNEGKEQVAKSSLAKYLGYAKPMAAGFAKEGFMEENLQTAIQNYEMAHARNETKDNVLEGVAKNALLGFKGVANAILGEKLAKDEFDQAYSIMLGGVIGGPFNSIADYRERKEQKKKDVLASGFTDFLKKSLIAGDDVLTEEINGVFDTDENGKRTLSKEKFIAFMDNIQRGVYDPAIKELSTLEDDKILNELVRPMAALKMAYRVFNNELHSDLEQIVLDKNEFYNEASNSANFPISNKEIIDEVIKIFRDTKAEHTSVDKIKAGNESVTANYIKQIGYLKAVRFLVEKSETLKNLNTSKLFGDTSILDQYDEAIKELSSKKGYENFKALQEKETADTTKLYETLVEVSEIEAKLNEKDIDPTVKAELETSLKEAKNRLASSRYQDLENAFINGRDAQELASEAKFNIATSTVNKRAKFDSNNNLGRIIRNNVPYKDRLRGTIGNSMLIDDNFNKVKSVIESNFTHVKEVLDKLDIDEISEDYYNGNDAEKQVILDYVTRVAGILNTAASEILINSKSLAETLDDSTSRLEFLAMLKLLHKDLIGLIKDPTENISDDEAIASILSIKTNIGNDIIDQLGELFAAIKEGIAALEKVNGIDSSTTASLDKGTIEFAEIYSVTTDRKLMLATEATLTNSLDEVDAIINSIGVRDDIEAKTKTKITSILEDLKLKIKQKLIEAKQETGLRQYIQEHINVNMVSIAKELALASGITPIPEDVTTIKGILAHILKHNNEIDRAKLKAVITTNLSKSGVASVVASMSKDPLRHIKNLFDYERIRKAVDNIGKTDLTTQEKNDVESLSNINKDLLEIFLNKGKYFTSKDPFVFIANYFQDELSKENLNKFLNSKVSQADVDSTIRSIYEFYLAEIINIDIKLLGEYVQENVQSLSSQQQLSELFILAELGKTSIGGATLLLDGLAGAGKTHTLVAVGTALHNIGKKVNIINFSPKSTVLNEKLAKANNHSADAIKTLVKEALLELEISAANPSSKAPRQAFDKLNAILSKGSITIIDEAYLADVDTLKLLGQIANKNVATLLLVGDPSQMVDDSMLSNYNHIGNIIGKVGTNPDISLVSNRLDANGLVKGLIYTKIPTLSVSYRTSHPGIATAYNKFYFNNSPVIEIEAMLNQEYNNPADFNKDTKGSLIVNDLETLVKLVNTDTGRTKLFIVSDEDTRDEVLKLVDPAKVKVLIYTEMQGVEADEVYVHLSPIYNSKGSNQNRMMYTAISRAEKFVAITYKGTQLEHRNVSEKGYADEFIDIKNMYEKGLMEASKILGVNPPKASIPATDPNAKPPAPPTPPAPPVVPPVTPPASTPHDPNVPIPDPTVPPTTPPIEPANTPVQDVVISPVDMARNEDEISDIVVADNTPTSNPMDEILADRVEINEAIEFEWVENTYGETGTGFSKEWAIVPTASGQALYAKGANQNTWYRVAIPSRDTLRRLNIKFSTEGQFDEAIINGADMAKKLAGAAADTTMTDKTSNYTLDYTPFRVSFNRQAPIEKGYVSLIINRIVNKYNKNLTERVIEDDIKASITIMDKSSGFTTKYSWARAGRPYLRVSFSSVLLNNAALTAIANEPDVLAAKDKLYKDIESAYLADRENYGNKKVTIGGKTYIIKNIATVKNNHKLADNEGKTSPYYIEMRAKRFTPDDDFFIPFKTLETFIQSFNNPNITFNTVRDTLSRIKRMNKEELLNLKDFEKEVFDVFFEKSKKTEFTLTENTRKDLKNPTTKLHKALLDNLRIAAKTFIEDSYAEDNKADLIKALSARLELEDIEKLLDLNGIKVVYTNIGKVGEENKYKLYFEYNNIQDAAITVIIKESPFHINLKNSWRRLAMANSKIGGVPTRFITQNGLEIPKSLTSYDASVASTMKEIRTQLTQSNSTMLQVFYWLVKNTTGPESNLNKLTFLENTEFYTDHMKYRFRWYRAKLLPLLLKHYTTQLASDPDAIKEYESVIKTLTALIGEVGATPFEKRANTKNTATFADFDEYSIFESGKGSNMPTSKDEALSRFYNALEFIFATHVKLNPVTQKLIYARFDSTTKPDQTWMPINLQTQKHEINSGDIFSNEGIKGYRIRGAFTNTNSILEHSDLFSYFFKPENYNEIKSILHAVEDLNNVGESDHILDWNSIMPTVTSPAAHQDLYRHIDLNLGSQDHETIDSFDRTNEGVGKSQTGDRTLSNNIEENFNGIVQDVQFPQARLVPKKQILAKTLSQNELINALANLLKDRKIKVECS